MILFLIKLLLVVTYHFFSCLTLNVTDTKIDFVNTLQRSKKTFEKLV